MAPRRTEPLKDSIASHEAARVAAFLLLSVVASCGPSGTNDASYDAGPPPPLAPDAFCTRVMSSLDENWCGYRGRCCTPFQLGLMPTPIMVWPVPWTCDQPLDTRISACTAALTSSTYNATSAGACAIAVESHPGNLQCNGPDAYYGLPLPEQTSPACGDIGGAGGAGAACTTSSACASGICVTGDAGTSGTCAATTVAVGAPCSSNLDCTHDAYCAGGMDAGIAVCRYRQQNGETCGPDGLGFDQAPECRSTYCNGGICLPFCYR
jgi:hypothetical protein